MQLEWVFPSCPPAPLTDESWLRVGAQRRPARPALGVLCPIRLAGYALMACIGLAAAAAAEESRPAPPVDAFTNAQQLLVDNDSLHTVTEKSATVWLPAGYHGIRVAWFNGPGLFDLQVEYEGPGLPRRRIPDASLFRIEANAGGATSNLVHGLDYRCYEGAWQQLPDFQALSAVKAGTAANFDLAVRTRDEEVGLEFTGYLAVPRDGFYTFWTKSDDGSKLFIGESPLRLSLLKPPADFADLVVTNVAQLRSLGSTGQRTNCPVQLNGLILAAGRARRVVAFQDESGAALLELSSRSRQVRAGQTVSLQGNCSVEGTRLMLRNPPLVENDGVHSMAERVGAILLNPGEHSIRVAWFNRDAPYGLEIYYQGPGLPRRRIPDSALFRQETDPATGALRWVSGLDYRCYHGRWLRVPDYTLLAPVKQGTIRNFDSAIASRTDNVGLEFSGYLEVPRAGIYTFSTVSDDGSLLFIDEQPPQIEVTGTNALPVPLPIAAGQILRADQQAQWSEVEGTVTFASEQSGELCLEVSSAGGRMRVEIADSSGAFLPPLLNSRIRALGICQSSRTTDGQIVAGTLLTPSLAELEVLEAASAKRSDRPRIPIGQPVLTNSLEDLNALPLLTTAEQVKRLNREEAQRAYPVKIRGVITTVLVGGFFIQDSTRAIYVRAEFPLNTDFARIGDYWEVEGVTFAEFAPNIRARTAIRLGPGALPEPLRPTWDQLINGSLDTQYVEVQGIVTAVDSDCMALLTRAGKIKVQFSDLELSTLKRYENALIRVRGCVIPVRDINTQRVELGRLRLSNASLTVEEPAPADVFALPLKPASDLLLFDPRAGALQRVKISGQLLHQRGEELYLADGANGFRAIPRTSTPVRVGDQSSGLERSLQAAPISLNVGDQVEVVGFPDLGGPSPALREAVVRQTGHSSLPAPHALPEDALLSSQHDATLVCVTSHLASVSVQGSDQVMVLQAGTRGFVARLKTSQGFLHLLPGSLLELIGVYAGQGGNKASGRDLDSFEILLNSPAGIRVLERPSWWSLRHTLTVLGAMGFVILATLVWITLLRRQVEERSRQLAAAVQLHEHTERQRALEEERARIARDLHDDLGATLTQVRLLSALTSRDAQVPETTRGRMGQVSEKSREMVASLDEIVWAVNPANDSLSSLATYLCQFAEEFLRPTSIRCRLDVDDGLPQEPLTSEVRHNVYLAVREALNNIAKHSEATEVWLRIQWQAGELRISLEDNGRGFSHPSTGAAGEGLANMRRRLEQIGGRFQCETRPRAGTVCRIWLPLDSRK